MDSSSTQRPDDASDEDAFDAFLDALERGEAPAVDDFLKSWPRASEELAERLRTLGTKLKSGVDRFESIGGMPITGTLGRGGMGEVFSAYDAALDRQVAVKVLLSPLAHQQVRIERLRAEARILAALDHPGVAIVHSLGLESESGEPLHIVMELVRGQDLARALRSGGPFGVPKSIDVLLQVASALGSAHERGILHRDLKPSNVMLRPDGVVKVLDFGISSRSSAPSSAEGTITRRGGGTPGYMSPEQERSEPQDARTDVWAFGQLCVELLTGRSGVRVGELEAQMPAGVPESLVHLIERCLSDDPAGRPANGQALVEALDHLGDLALAQGPGPLPLPRSRGLLIGRENELDRIDQALGAPPTESARWITLVGPAGVGKTRLAIEALARRGGAYLARLSAASSATAPEVIRRALGAGEGNSDGQLDLTGSALERLRKIDHPLLLDNCEHVLDSVRPFARRCLEESPGAVLLATSREPLDLDGELVIRVGPLPPAAATQLFNERARDAGGADFAAASPPVRTKDEAGRSELVARVCDRLDGLPLAIELAASRAALLGMTGLQRAVEAGEVARGDGPAGRHGSLDAALRWSFDLLSATERRMLLRLSTFRQAFTLHQAEALALHQGWDPADDVLEGLGSLTKRSLLTRDGLGGRWRLLRTVRDFAAARLRADAAELAATEEAHGKVMLDLARDAALMSFGERRRSSFDALEASLDDLIAACERSCLRGEGGGAREWASALSDLFEFWLSRGLLQAGDRLLRVALGAARPLDESEFAQAYLTLGTIAHRLGHWVGARKELARALEHADASGSEAVVAKVLRNQAFLALDEGRHDEAEAGFRRALSMETELDHLLRMGAIHNDLGLLRRQQGRLEEAAQEFERGLRLRRESGCAWGVASSLGNLGEVHGKLGAHAQARTFLNRSRGAFEALGDVRSLAESLEISAALECSCQHHRTAATLLGVAAALRERIDFPCPPAGQQRIDALLAQLQSAMGSDELYSGLRAGEVLTLSEALHLAGR